MLTAGNVREQRVLLHTGCGDELSSLGREDPSRLCSFEEKYEWLPPLGQIVHCMQNRGWKALTWEKRSGNSQGHTYCQHARHNLWLLSCLKKNRNDLLSSSYSRKEQDLMSMQETSCPAISYQQFCSIWSERVTWVDYFVCYVCIIIEFFRGKKINLYNSFRHCICGLKVNAASSHVYK